MDSSKSNKAPTSNMDSSKSKKAPTSNMDSSKSNEGTQQKVACAMEQRSACLKQEQADVTHHEVGSALLAARKHNNL
eukprot:921339-Pelagomonas_calceolata.AAC.2